MVGAVGNDPEGSTLTQRLAAFDVDTTLLAVENGHASGNATILVDAVGENVIAIEDGANAAVTPSTVASHMGTIRESDILVLQCEIPVAAIEAALESAESLGTRTLLNLAPYTEISSAIRYADPLVLNEVEAAQLIDEELVDLDVVKEAAAKLLSLSRSVVVTLGAAGAIVADIDGVELLPAREISDVTDTTGAGDAFVGVLAAGLARGDSLRASAAMAIVAAGETIRHRGAAESYFSIQPISDKTSAN
jgi:ribokinase